MFCQYKNIFGVPGEGVHSTRIFNIAIVDVIFTIILGLILSKYLSYSIYHILVILFLLGIFFHRIFCVRTTVDKLLFDDKNI
jgi:hypothetical protein